MNKNSLGRLLSPDFWIGIFCLLFVVGIACFIVGHRHIGLALMVPLVLGGLVAFFIFVPLVLRADRKSRKSPSKDGEK
jgi:hypothetical protein